jgi:hypothetical protein
LPPLLPSCPRRWASTCFFGKKSMWVPAAKGGDDGRNKSRAAAGGVNRCVGACADDGRTKKVRPHHATTKNPPAIASA